MNTKRKLSFGAFLSTFLIVLLFAVSFNFVYAYFTATANRNITLNFATLEIDMQNESDVTLSSGTFTERLTGVIPGDEIDFTGIYIKNTGTGDSYVLVKVNITVTTGTGAETNINEWYNLEGEKVEVSNFTSNTVAATSLSSGSKEQFKFTWNLTGATYTDAYQNATISANFTAYAIQSYLPDNEEYGSDDALYASYLIYSTFTPTN